MAKFRTAYNGIAGEAPARKSELPSATQPGDSMTIQEMMKRHKAGQNLPGVMTSYFDTEDLSKINHLFKNGIDLTELDELSEKVAGIQESIVAAAKRKQEIEKAEAIKAEAEAIALKKAEEISKQQSEE